MLGGDVMRQRMVAERGYTNHPGGMYSDKFTHPKLHCEAGRYISIGDPYVAEAEKRPGRWKEKQMGTTMYPKNAGNGYFGNMGKPFEYMPDKYVESLPYAKSQPYDQRKLGFGTHDASKRDEYTQAIKTEQYRDLLRREKRILSAQEKKKGGLAEQIRKAHKKLAEAAVEEEATQARTAGCAGAMAEMMAEAGCMVPSLMATTRDRQLAGLRCCTLTSVNVQKERCP